MSSSATRTPLRSLLFVPGDSERKQAKALGSGADALILDLEDSVQEAQLPAARVRVEEFLLANATASVRPQLWVRVNSPSSGKLPDDLAAVLPAKPDGVVLPKVSAASEVADVGRQLSELESRSGISVGATKVLVIATETPAALLRLSDYATGAAGDRLVGLTWGMEDLSAALGSLAKTDGQGNLTPPFELARTLCLVTAAAAGVQAIDGVHADFRNGTGLARDVARARRDGFTAKMAIHPDQVPVINAGFGPTAADIERARRIVAAFENSSGAGVISLDGQMLDRPHLLLARRVLELAARTKQE